ncbi:3'-5' exonuclease, partial [Rhodococcus hoagii]|nr:3'-5' exonuclease [Prescottella equi]
PAAWHAERQRDLVEYLRSEGRDASDVDGRWPIRGAA